MTIIAALSGNDGTWIGCDTGLVIGDRRMSGTRKWATYNSWGIALAGDWRIFNIIDLNKRKLLNKLKSHEEFVDRLFEVFEENAVGRDSEGDFTRSFGQSFMLAKKNGPVWNIDCCLSTSEIPLGELWALGTGSEYALGAGFALENEAESRDRLQKSLEAAIKYCVSCGGDMWIKKL